MSELLAEAQSRLVCPVFAELDGYCMFHAVLNSLAAQSFPHFASGWTPKHLQVHCCSYIVNNVSTDPLLKTCSAAQWVSSGRSWDDAEISALDFMPAILAKLCGVTIEIVQCGVPPVLLNGAAPETGLSVKIVLFRVVNRFTDGTAHYLGSRPLVSNEVPRVPSEHCCIGGTDYCVWFALRREFRACLNLAELPVHFFAFANEVLGLKLAVSCSAQVPCARKRDPARVSAICFVDGQCYYRRVGETAFVCFGGNWLAPVLLHDPLISLVNWENGKTKPDAAQRDVIDRRISEITAKLLDSVDKVHLFKHVSKLQRDIEVCNFLFVVTA